VSYAPRLQPTERLHRTLIRRHEATTPIIFLRQFTLRAACAKINPGPPLIPRA